MRHDPPLRESLVALSSFFVGDGTLQEALQHVAERAVEAIEAADLAGVTMLVEGRNRTGVFTDEAAPEIDQAQYETGEGPCLDAFHHGVVNVIEDTLEPGPWPAFRAAASEHGMRSTLSLPLTAEERSLGALNLYSRTPRGFSEDDVTTGELFSTQAAIVLANAQAYWDAQELTIRLREAMLARAVIEQAKGILMARQGCDADGAFAVLVKASQRENVKLRTIAQRIVDAVGSQDGSDGDALEALMR